MDDYYFHMWREGLTFGACHAPPSLGLSVALSAPLRPRNKATNEPETSLSIKKYCACTKWLSWPEGVGYLYNVPPFYLGC